MDRFSRDAGEAMSMVKNLQKTYHIQIVSVSEGIIFDYDTPGSFFRALLELTNKITSLAPAINDWEFYPAEQPKE